MNVLDAVRAGPLACALIALSVASAGHAQSTPAKPGPKKEQRRSGTAKLPAPPPPLVLEPAGGEQLAAAAMVHFGDYACEFSQQVSIGLTPGHDGYIDVKFGPSVYTMRPVLSSTGALRLEDMRGEMLMLQIAFKSMMMNTKTGRRMVDECVHPKQADARLAYEAGPPAEGFGIAPGTATAPSPAPAK